MLKTFAAIAFSAVVAGAITGYPDFVSPVKASAPVADAPVIAAPACPEQGWPYQTCNSAGTKPVIRVIAIDKVK